MITNNCVIDHALMKILALYYSAHACMHVVTAVSFCTQTVDGVAIGETRDDSKEFKYDHSFWSVDKQDLHFVTQEQVIKIS